MNKLFLLLIVFGYSAGSYACRGKIDPKKVVIFIDTNGSYEEAVKAEKAAKDRCETFKMIPFSSLKVSKQFGQIGKSLNYYNVMTNKYCPSEDPEKNKGKKLSSSKCKKYTKYLGDTNTKAEKLKKKHGAKVDKSIVDAQIKKLAADGVAITSIIASGHDGGGAIRGDLKGPFKDWNINKNNIIRSFNEAYEGKPELKNQLHSVFMWGCYTATPGEIIEWREGIPSLRIVAGFHGSGPANWQKSSANLLAELLKKENEIKKKKSERDVKKMVDGIKDLHTTYSGFYYNNCQGQDYYFNKKSTTDDSGNKKYTKRFSRFEDAVGCDTPEAQKTLKIVRYEIPLFNSGKDVMGKSGKPLNRYTRLRQLYNYAREYSMCIDADSPIDPDRIGLLLFYDGVRKNFDKVFGKELYDVFTAIEKSPATNDSFKQYFDKIRDAGGMKNVSRGFLPSLLANLETIALSKNPNHPPGLVEAAKKQYDIVDKYLYRLDPDCMDFLDWHDEAKGHTPEARCK